MGRNGQVGSAIRRVAQAASLATFVLGLGIGIVVGLPLIGCAALVGGARFATRVRGCVSADRRISFGSRPAVYETAIAPRAGYDR